MYLWLLELRQSQCRHEKEIKADCPGNNNGIQCTRPIAFRFRKCTAFSCFVRLNVCCVFVCKFTCVYLVKAQSIPIYNPVQAEGQRCKYKPERAYKHACIPPILLLARLITSLPGLPLS